MKPNEMAVPSHSLDLFSLPEEEVVQYADRTQRARCANLEAQYGPGLRVVIEMVISVGIDIAVNIHRLGRMMLGLQQRETRRDEELRKLRQELVELKYQLELAERDRQADEYSKLFETEV